ADSDKRRAQNGTPEPSNNGGGFSAPSDNSFSGVDPFASANQNSNTQSTAPNEAANPFAASGKTEIDISDDDLPF
ncbi:MAG: single-stranded DNA-binding protein, partial [Leuconostoc gelidum]